jgi:hypothetical protein
MSQTTWYSGQARPEQTTVSVNLGDALKEKEKPHWKSKWITQSTIFTGVGCALLLLLSIVPMWNALMLLQDTNYVFWLGRCVPQIILITCVSIIIIYAITIALFFRRSESSGKHGEQVIMMIANVFITLFGLFLLIVSLPMTNQAETTYANLLYRCDYSDQTHRLYEYSTVLHNIRSTPACLSKNSVEECDGFERVEPYMSFLKGMENNFYCSGFCYKAPDSRIHAAMAQVNSTALLQGKKQRSGRQQTALKVEEALVEENAAESVESKSSYVPSYVPTLFSLGNYEPSCDGMSARDIKNFAGEMGKQTYCQGIYLVFIAVTTGMLKLFGLCVRKA